MKVVITGAGGGVGRALVELAPAGHRLVPLTRRDLDVRDFAAVLERIVPHHPDVVLHLAAMTSVDGCEEDPKGAGLTNVLGSFNVAYAAERSGALLVALSTDYVFDGKKGEPYVEDDEPNPLSVYGATKLEAERIVRAVCPQHLVVRTSWVFGAGDDYLTGAVRRLAAGQTAGGVSDQVASPTYVKHLAERLVPLAGSGTRGLVHLGGPEAVSWHDVLARARTIGDLPGEVVEQKAAELSRPPPRPVNSALESRVLPRTGVAPMPPLDHAIRELVEGIRGR
jgi:dTDP-4-dehydrorhamnose reductase